MFVIYGVKNRQRIKKPTVVATCKGCGKESVKKIVKTDTCGTIFFIPVFVCNSKYYLGCPECGTLEKISKKKYKMIKQACKAGSPAKMTQVEKLIEEGGVKLSEKDKMMKDIDAIMEQLAKINYKPTEQNKEKIKKAIKENLAKTYSDKMLIEITVEEYFAKILLN